jgi:hypothetical protein
MNVLFFYNGLIKGAFVPSVSSRNGTLASFLAKYDDVRKSRNKMTAYAVTVQLVQLTVKINVTGHSIS